MQPPKGPEEHQTEGPPDNSATIVATRRETHLVIVNELADSGARDILPLMWIVEPIKEFVALDVLEWAKVSILGDASLVGAIVTGVTWAWVWYKDRPTKWQYHARGALFAFSLIVVPTENSESAEKPRVLGFTAIVFSGCLNMCAPSSRLLPAGSAVGPFWNWRTSPSVTSCMFFVANGGVGPGCLR
jgi:hypothetical protein